MRVWLLGAGSVLAVAAVVTAAAAHVLRRRVVPRLPLRHPVGAADQQAVRDLVAGRHEVEAIQLVRDRYRLVADDARAVVGDVAAHGDYPPDWAALAASLDPDLRDEVRRLAATGRRSAALGSVRRRFDLTLPDADRLVTAIEQDASPEEA